MSPAILAVNAGNDIILTSQFYEHLSATIEAVNNNTIPMEVIDKACKRIIAWKIKYLGARYIEDNGKDKVEVLKNELASDHTLLIIILSLVFLIVLGYVARRFFCKKKSNDDIQSIDPQTNFI